MDKKLNQQIFEETLLNKHLHLFTLFDVRKIFSLSPSAATLLLHRYTKKGLVVRLKNGLYLLRHAAPPEAQIANKLYAPSYVSREFALSHHGVIPETVYEITSVTPKATRQFDALGKIYSYRRIMPRAFTGYALEKQAGTTFLIADAEKAFVDAMYYRLRDGSAPIARFHKKKLDHARVFTYAQLFKNKKLVSALKKIFV